jgi:hypothetical protein
MAGEQVNLHRGWVSHHSPVPQKRGQDVKRPCFMSRDDQDAQRVQSAIPPQWATDYYKNWTPISSVGDENDLRVILDTENRFHVLVFEPTALPQIKTAPDACYTKGTQWQFAFLGSSITEPTLAT